MVKTDIAIAIPPGTYARIAPRSGLAVKHFIDTGKQQPLVLVCMLQDGHGHAACIDLTGKQPAATAAACESQACPFSSTSEKPSLPYKLQLTKSMPPFQQQP